MSETGAIFLFLYSCAVAIHTFLALLIWGKSRRTREESAYAWFMTICALWHTTNGLIVGLPAGTEYLKLTLSLNNSLLAFLVGGLIHTYAAHGRVVEEKPPTTRGSIANHIAAHSTLYIGLAYGICGLFSFVFLAYALRPDYVPATLARQASSGVLYFFLLAATVVVATKPPADSVRDRSFLHSPIMIKLALFLMAALSGLYIFGLARIEPVRLYIEPLTRLISVPFAIALAFWSYRFQFMDRFVRNSIRILLSLALAMAIYFLSFTLRASVSEDVQRVVAIGSLSLLLFLAPFADRYICGVVDWYLLKRRINLDKALFELSRILSMAGDLNDLLRDAAAHIKSVLLTQSANIELCPVSRNNQGTTAPVWPSSASTDLKAQADRYFPLASKNHLLGRLVVGKRENGFPYLSEELRFLRTAATLLATSLDAHLAREEQITVMEALQEKELREQRLLAEAARAELRALRAQIDPHFLFNTLSTIADLISYEPEKAEAMTERLAEVFRYVLTHTEKDFVSLAEELEFIKAYLDIEKIRFGDRLNTGITAAPATLPHLIPPLLLQPIVENSIKHGLAPKISGGLIQISAEDRGDHLEIVITDDGIGMVVPEESLLQGVGLKNVRDRLRIAYGDRAHLTIRGAYQKETIVQIEIPKL